VSQLDVIDQSEPHRASLITPALPCKPWGTVRVVAGKLSAGIVVMRNGATGPELLVVHPGGPFWRNKDEHAWSVPKGEVEADPETGALPTEVGLDRLVEETARREFTEETGHPVPDGPLVALPEFGVGSGKKLRSFMVRGDLDATTITGATSNTFELEWPPRSGRLVSFPEVDAARWVPLAQATSKLHKGQAKLIPLIEALLDETSW
jgi:predicted NUDIX family NTP pyrophosphohydrolase